MAPTDIITLHDAIEGPALWSVIAALEPERPIMVKMTYADLYALARMIMDKKEEIDGRTRTD